MTPHDTPTIRVSHSGLHPQNAIDLNGRETRPREITTSIPNPDPTTPYPNPTTPNPNYNPTTPYPYPTTSNPNSNRTILYPTTSNPISNPTTSNPNPNLTTSQSPILILQPPILFLIPQPLILILQPPIQTLTSRLHTIPKPYPTTSNPHPDPPIPNLNPALLFSPFSSLTARVDLFVDKVSQSTINFVNAQHDNNPPLLTFPPPSPNPHPHLPSPTSQALGLGPANSTALCKPAFVYLAKVQDLGWPAERTQKMCNLQSRNSSELGSLCESLMIWLNLSRI
ncbi:soluble scavenger receptor cysteine-rich domain-containing protein SSC5D-like [Penaeus vannamei]|uniref:soluble scavenger receptor cysteine-rich domain-containing protein SSC5D-like n=1 Tax=Penaeus vannamei TaxID=6689 RepID=UPI00387F8254